MDETLETTTEAPIDTEAQPESEAPEGGEPISRTAREPVAEAAADEGDKPPAEELSDEQHESRGKRGRRRHSGQKSSAEVDWISARSRR